MNFRSIFFTILSLLWIFLVFWLSLHNHIFTFILSLLVEAFLGGLVAYFMMSSQVKFLQRQTKSLQRENRLHQENIDKTHKELDLEIRARDRKITKSQEKLSDYEAKYQALQLEIETLSKQIADNK
jgi:uncharacterized protein HemX